MSDDIECFLVDVRELADPDADGNPLFDLIRVDDGTVIEHAVFYLGHRAPAGAMWWHNIDVGPVPTGPDDWSMNTPEEIEMAKNQLIEHPEWYPTGGDPATGIPHKRPSGIFASGPHLYVQTPGGSWNIDSRASNCSLPWDYEHRCWIRTGEPPKVTAGKDGPTCDAGAGSIRCGDYHGFLRNGVLTTRG